jgi:hypothetical protein
VEEVKLYYSEHNAHEHVGAPRSLVRVNIPPMRYVNHGAFASSTCHPSHCFDEVWHHVMTEEYDACGIVPFYDPLIYYVTRI